MSIGQSYRFAALPRDAGVTLARLRASGRMPAVVYGGSGSPVAISVDRHDFEQLYARVGTRTPFDLEIAGGPVERVVIREVQYHPRRLGAQHADFLRVTG